MAQPQTGRDDITPESRDLIDEFLRNKGATVFQPFLAPGNESPRATRELVARRRREFRKANKPVKPAKSVT
jgi:hypothetical protein